MAAALKVIEILEETDAYQRMKLAGTQLVDGARVMANLAGFGPNMFSVDGHPHWSFFNFYDEQGNVDVAARSLWIQEVTRRGVLILTTFNICSALSQAQVENVLKAFGNAFKVLQKARQDNVDYAELVDGPLPVPAFRAR